MNLPYRLFIFLILQCWIGRVAFSQEHRNIHYYTGSGDIRWDLLTHLILFDKSNLDADGRLIPPSASEVASIARLRREAMVHGKTLIYGLTGSFASYQPMLSDPLKRAAFIDGVATMIDRYELDGVDFDIEYPATSADFALMDTFYAELRARVGVRPLLTASVAHWQVQMNASTINNSLDWVQTMGYYFRTASQSASDLTRYADAGVSRAKLSLGVPFAGKSQNSPTIPWDIGYHSLVSKIMPFDPAVNSVFYVDGDFQFVGVNFQKEKLRVAADGGGGTMVWHHTVDVTDSLRSVAVSLHEESVRYVAPIDGFELPVGVAANTLYQSGSAAIQGSYTRVNGLTGAEVKLSFNGNLYGQSKIRSKDAVIGYSFPSGASIRLDYKVIDAASNVTFYLKLRDSAGNYIQSPAYQALSSIGWKRLTYARSSFTNNASFNENDIRSYEILAQSGSSGSAFTSRVVLDNLVMIAPDSALRPVVDTDADGFTDLLEQQLGTSAVDSAAMPAAEFAGMHAWWRLDEASYPVCADAVRGIHGMASGGNRVAGKIGNALQLDGVADRILMAPAASVVGTGPFTLAAWVKTSDADGGMILQQRDASSNGYQGQYQLRVTSQGTVSFSIYNGGYQFDFATTTTIRDGQWHHVAAVRDGTEGRIFIDGVLAGQASGELKSLEARSVAVGCDYRDNTEYLNATLDDIRIYRRALNAQDLIKVSSYTPSVLMDRSVSYDDRIPVGSPITTISVQGALAGCGTVYRIVRGDPTGQFQLDATTGVLRLVRHPDATSSGLQVLTVEAVTDGLSSSRVVANISLNLILFAKQANTDALNLGSSWVDGIVPGVDHVALWNHIVPSASTVALGADCSWMGLRIADPGGLITIPAGNTLMLGAGGIDMSEATQDLTINSSIVVGASQLWNVASGRTLIRSAGNTSFNGGTTTSLSGLGTVEFAGVQGLTGAGDLVIKGGILYNNLQGGAIDRSGDTKLESGVIKIQTSVNLFGSGVLHLNGGAIGSGNANARTISNPLMIGGDPVFGGSGFGSGVLIFTGNVDLMGGSRTFLSNYTTGLGVHISGVVSNGSVIKSGEGILTLSGMNAYVGGTTIQSGILLANNLSGSATGSGFVNVSSTATLGGSGLISGSVSLDGAISPGNNGVGTLTVGALTLNGGSRIVFEVNDWNGEEGIGYDKIAASSVGIMASQNQPIQIVVTPANLVNFSNVTRSFMLISASSGITGFSPNQFIVDGSSISTATGTWSVQQSGNKLMLVYTGSNVAPVFMMNPIDRGDVAATRAWTGSIAGLAFDSNVGDALSFSKTSGPGWLSVGGDGVLSGTPGVSDLGVNIFGVRVTDSGGLFALATLVIMVASTPQQAWQFEQFGANADNPAIAGDMADPDHDGLNNFAEYAFGLMPNSGVSANPIVMASHLMSGSFQYKRRSIALSGLRYGYEASSTLSGEWLPFVPVSETSNSDTPVEIVTVGMPKSLTGKPVLFVRVKAMK